MVSFIIVVAVLPTMLVAVVIVRVLRGVVTHGILVDLVETIHGTVILPTQTPTKATAMLTNLEVSTDLTHVAVVTIKVLIVGSVTIVYGFPHLTT